MNSLPNEFKLYLEKLSLTPKTVKNYLSDNSHFLGWAILQLKTIYPSLSDTNDLTSYFSIELIESYKRFLLSNKTPVRTANRRLSTVRQLGRFLVAKGTIVQNPADKIKNIAAGPYEHAVLLGDFRKYLEEENVRPKTVKNYVSDTQGFLKFVKAIEEQNGNQTVDQVKI